MTFDAYKYESYAEGEKIVPARYHYAIINIVGNLSFAYKAAN